jgi:calcineurin-like phosphoesterase family protein
VIWFSSDHHFHHGGIIRMTNRPWRTISSMNTAMTAHHNAVVAPTDTVYILGDFCFGSRKNCLDAFDQLNGVKHLIIGNHDDNRVRGMPWASKQTSKLLDLGDLSIMMSHKPPVGPRRMSADMMYLHGHLHQRTRGHGNVIDVGVDANAYTPLSIDFIYALARMHRDGVASKLRELRA